ncbi:flagellar basal-body MS-ring/collar protein FliF [Pseudomarimonas salicorniae]|uniref:Flagellar M-ring protein n=1 Tax=Pseudomarimonas salicorniae TaxID=2933270 RepID=A0ABT0GKS9_9GAMM|nr:flagellar basal-body MS-ring/collar protein FliF [Lysobacter sp. CAU 1642]MCK7595151.1 flagellar M-ring protein FliF [Lysobacter sp. CAU 1642]
MSAVVETRTTEVRTSPAKDAAQRLANTRIQEMPAIRQLIQVVMLAAALALGLWLFFWTQQPGYATLYSGLADRDAAELSEALRSANIPFKLESGGTAIAVPEDQLNEARLKMAAQGLPQGSRSGFEMIEGEQGFGVSQFVEGARYQMALETELARTIMTLRPVRNARVHLAMPKPSAFTRQRDEAAASVLLELFAGRAMDSNQVKAIVHLVATSVPNLAPERVTVIDQSGRLLTQPDPDSEDAVNDRQFEQVQRLQNDYAARIARLLEPMTGPGRVSAQVSIDMDFSTVEEAREVYGADPQKVRSEQVAEESMTGTADGGIPGAVANTPPTGEPAQAGAPGALPSSASRSATRNFEMDRTLVHSRQQPGRVTRVSAAVLVDNIPRGVDAEGNAVTAPLEADEIARIEALVREAIGFNAERGDSVSVVNAGFTRPEPMAELEPPPFWENPSLMQWARLGAGALAVILVLFAVVKPALNRVLNPPAPQTRRQLAEDEDELDEETVEARAAARIESERRAGESQARKMSPEEEAQGILAGPENYEQRLTVAKAAVAQDPRRVAQVVRGWVNAGE